MFELKPEYLLIQKMAREFARNEVKPLAAEIDKTERFPTETVEKLFRTGLFGTTCPKEYGGQGGDTMAYVLALEEVARRCATTAVIWSVHGGLCMYLLNRYGTETFITNAGQAGLYIILASTDRSKKTRGITAFLVSADNPGLTVGPPEDKMGIRASATCEVVLTDCRVPATDILGVEGQGFKLALAGLDCGRIGIGTQAVGIAQGAIDETIAYVNTRVQFGQRLSQMQNTQFVLAGLQTKVDAARLLVWRAAELRDGGQPFGKEAAMAKLFASETANEVTRACVQLFGGYGYTRAYPIERMMRDAKITEIYEGTSEAQKIVISRAIGVK